MGRAAYFQNGLLARTWKEERKGGELWKKIQGSFKRLGNLPAENYATS